MSIESMKRISQAEEEAVSIRRQAQTEAKLTQDQSKKQAADIISAAKKQAEENYRAILAKAEEEAEAVFEGKLAAVQNECESMKSEARAKLPEAVKIITGKVVKSSGNS